jgi:hypothetical protein
MIGSPLKTLTSGIVTSGIASGILTIRNSNSFTQGTIVNQGSTLNLETGGAPWSTPIGTGALEIMNGATVSVQGATGSLYNGTSTPNAILLRIGAILQLDNSTYAYTGSGDRAHRGCRNALPQWCHVPLEGSTKLADGGKHRDGRCRTRPQHARHCTQHDGSRECDSWHRGLDVPARTGTTDRGMLFLSSTAGMLGVPTALPYSNYERIVFTGGLPVPWCAAGTTSNGVGVTNAWDAGALDYRHYKQHVRRLQRG